MQLLLASDLHYALKQFDWILEQAPDFDVVVLAGDLLDLAGRVDLAGQVVVLSTYVRRLAEVTTVIVSSGNHDLTARNDLDEKHADWIEGLAADDVIVDWDRLDLGDLRITVCPWWDGPRTRERVDAQLRADAADRPARWVWVYHYPPDESPVSWVGDRHIGDRDLNGWIDQHRPDLVLTGHIHDSPFRPDGSWVATLDSTTVVNAGAQPGPIPAHVIIDTEAGQASWWSAYGSADAQIWAG